MPRQKMLFLCVSAMLLLSLACSTLTGGGQPTTGVDFSSLAATNNAAMGTVLNAIGTEPSIPGFDTPVPTEEPQPTSAGPVTANIGDVVMDGDMRFVVGGWNPVEPSDTIQPDSGNRVIAVDVTVVYAGKKTFDFSESNFVIKDSDSREYNKTIDVSPIIGASNYATLFQGERLHTVIGFQVPQTSTGLTFVYNGDSYLGYAKAFVTLGDQPGVKAVPAGLPGETQPSVTAFGQTAACMKWNIQLFEVKPAPANSMLTSILPSGYNILLTDMSLENTDTVSHDFTNFTMIWVQDATGWRYPYSWFTSEAVTANSLDSLSQLVAGEKSRGWMGFTTPENADPGSLTMVFWCGGEDYPNTVDKDFLALQ